MSRTTERADACGVIQTMPTGALVHAAAGLLDLNLIAREELASRGLGLDGRWLGFEAAQRILVGGGK